MFRGHIHPPMHGELKGLATVFQYLDGFGVAHPLEGGGDNTLQSRKHGVINALLEKRHVLAAGVEDFCNDMAQQRLGQIGIVIEIGKGDLRLNHPELGEVTGRMGILGAKGWAKGVYLGHGQAVGFDRQLARDGQERLTAKKVLAVVDTAIGLTG